MSSVLPRSEVQAHPPGRLPAGSGPLSGLLVADFSRVLAGPYCTMLLADMGAEVIKVESPEGDDLRHWKPPARGDEATYFLAINRNKRSICLDLKSSEDLDLAHRLSARADIMIQNFKVGGLRQFGLDYESVRARNPRAVYASISGFGSAGGAGLPGYDLLVQGMSGLMDLTGSPSGPGYRAGMSVFDITVALHTTIGILAALNHRSVTGEGQHIETNLLSSALSALAGHSSAYIAGGVTPTRDGNEHMSLFPYGPFDTADGQIIIAAGNDSQFAKLCHALGLSELLEDPRYATVVERNVNRTELKKLLLTALQAHTSEEWFDLLSSAGVPCGPINSIAGGVQLAERLGLRPVVEVGGPDHRVPTVRNPISFSSTPAEYRLTPPRLGQHTAELREWLLAPEQPSGLSEHDTPKEPSR
jgi:crotonobetainyl-CoA:carnitine CoA-transferase CaiB-like acyl-CoA transferase